MTYNLPLSILRNLDDFPAPYPGAFLFKNGFSEK